MILHLTPWQTQAYSDFMAIANFVTAFIVIYFMQVVTSDAGISSGLARLQFVQRALYLLLAIALFWNAIGIYFDGITPSPNGAFVEFSFFLVSAVSFLRHRTAPPLPGSPRHGWNWGWLNLPILR